MAKIGNLAPVKDFAVTTLVGGPYTASSTTLTVADGAVFPDTAAAGEFLALLWDSTSYNAAHAAKAAGVYEWLLVTSRAADALTVTRGQLGSSPQEPEAGWTIHMGPHAETINEIAYSLPYNVKRFGATGDGATDDRAAINDAQTAGDWILFPAGTYRVRSDLTFDSTKVLVFSAGAVLDIDLGVTVTANGVIRAGNQQISSGNGTLVIGSRQIIQYDRWDGTAADVLLISGNVEALAQFTAKNFSLFERASGYAVTIRVAGDTDYRFRVNSNGVLQWGPGNSTTADMAASGQTAGQLGGKVLELSRTGAVGVDLNDGTEAISINADGGQLKFVSETYGGTLMRLVGGADATKDGELVVSHRVTTGGAAWDGSEIVPDAAFGSTAAVSAVDATDHGGSFTITANGSGLAAGPTAAMTFKDGAWANTPAVVAVRGAGDQEGTPLIVSSVSTTGFTIKFPAITPNAAGTYRIRFVALGIKG